MKNRHSPPARFPEPVKVERVVVDVIKDRVGQTSFNATRRNDGGGAGGTGEHSQRGEDKGEDSPGVYCWNDGVGYD